MSSPTGTTTISRHHDYETGVSPVARAGEFEESLPEEKGTPWQGDLLQMFLRNQIHVAPTMPLLAVLMGVTAMLWTPVLVVVGWMIGVIGCNAMQIFMCRQYFKQARTPEEQRDWIGMMSASEFMLGHSGSSRCFCSGPTAMEPAAPFCWQLSWQSALYAS